MDFDALFERPSLAGQGISVVIRPHLSARSSSQALAPSAIVNKLLPLLAAQSRPAEILFLVDSFPPVMPAARINGMRVRFVRSTHPESGRSLMGAIRQTRYSILLLVDEPVSIDGAELKQLLERLELCDIVVGRRSKRWSWASFAWPADRLLRSLLGIPFTDPFCPIKIGRREAVCEIHLDRDGILADLELLAKGTSLVRLVDEVRLALKWNGPTICQALFSRFRDFIPFLFRPTFADQVNTSLPTVQGVSLARSEWKQTSLRGTVWGTVPRRSWRSVHPIEASRR